LYCTIYSRRYQGSFEGGKTKHDGAMLKTRKKDLAELYIKCMDHKGDTVIINCAPEPITTPNEINTQDLDVELTMTNDELKTSI
jgi:hypothetical protein